MVWNGVAPAGAAPQEGEALAATLGTAVADGTTAAEGAAEADGAADGAGEAPMPSIAALI